MKVALGRLKNLTMKALRNSGYSRDEASIMTDVLLYAQLRGNNQGVSKLLGAGLPKDPLAGEIESVRETRLSALLDGNRSPGIVVMARAVDMAIDKARETGLGIVGTFGTNSSTGALGYYARRFADQDLIGLVMSGSPPTVAVYGSFQPLFGTNPLAIGLPSDSGPVVFDMATAAIAWYGLVEAAESGRTIPDDVAFDRDGHPTSDPQLAMAGAIRPFDRSPKGSGLSMIVEALTGPLVSAAFAGIGDEPNNWGNLAIAMDAGVLVPREEFRRGVSQLVDSMKRARRLPEFDEIVAPGERGDRLTANSRAAGELEIEESLLRWLERVASER